MDSPLSTPAILEMTKLHDSSNGEDIPPLRNLDLPASSASATSEANNLHPSNERNLPIKIRNLINKTYDTKSVGPFEVIIENIVKQNPASLVQSRAISEIALGKKLIKLISTSWIHASDLKRIGQNRFSVFFSTKTAANHILENFDSISKLITSDSDDWIAYIPEYRLYKLLITKDIDPTENEQEILENIGPCYSQMDDWINPVKVLNIKKRVTANDHPDKRNLINTNLFLFTFPIEFNLLSANYLGKRISFSPFVQKVKRCFNCQRIGHLRIHCRAGGTGRRCPDCASNEHELRCNTSNKICINCKRERKTDSNHSADDPNCPVYVTQSRINLIMAKCNLGPREAKEFLVKHETRLDPSWFHIENLPSPPPSPILLEYFSSTPSSYAGTLSTPPSPAYFMKNFPPLTSNYHSSDSSSSSTPSPPLPSAFSTNRNKKKKYSVRFNEFIQNSDGSLSPPLSDILPKERPISARKRKRLQEESSSSSYSNSPPYVSPTTTVSSPTTVTENFSSPEKPHSLELSLNQIKAEICYNMVRQLKSLFTYDEQSSTYSFSNSQLELLIINLVNSTIKDPDSKHEHDQY